MTYDVVVVGSGLGGLVCGSLLARAGCGVVVLERQAQPGGCMQAYRRGGLVFDTGLHYVGGLGEGQRLHAVFDYLGLMRLPWHRLDTDGFDHVTIDGETFRHAEGFGPFVETLVSRFPNERKALVQYADLLDRVANMPLGDAGTFDLFAANAHDYLKATFCAPLLIDVLSGNALKMELRRVSLPLFTFTHGQGSYIQSSWRLRGSGQLLADKLVDTIRANGGTVACRCDVVELVEKEGKIVSARCANGEVYEGRTFVSDLHPATTFGLVGESARLKRRFRQRIESLPCTTGMFTASLVLRPSVLPYFNHNKYVYRHPGVWEFAEQPFSSDGEVGGVMVSARVPESGCHATQVDLLTPMPWRWCQPWADTHVGHRGTGYEAMKRLMAEACIRLASTVVPGLESMVEECHCSTPLTWRDYNRTPEGSAYGIRKDCRQPLMTLLSPRTPIANLLLTGQSLMLHGVEGVTMTALQTCGELIGKEKIANIFKIQQT